MPPSGSAQCISIHNAVVLVSVLQEETFTVYLGHLVMASSILVGYANIYVSPYNKMAFWRCWVQLPEYLVVMALCCLTHHLSTPGELTSCMPAWGPVALGCTDGCQHCSSMLG